VDDGKASLTNVTVSGNSAGDIGGGILNLGNLNLLNVTVADNSARQGGGLYNEGFADVRNTLIAGNHALSGKSNGHDVYGALASGGHNLVGIIDGSMGWDSTKGDLVGDADFPLDPRLGPLANNGGPTLTYALKGGSLAIDHGDNFAVTATDQRGQPRLKDGDGDGKKVVDIGAFEK
jgi:hypothetical protein